jgi:GH15 family glucan-1,4-alpha-glucosidase
MSDQRYPPIADYGFISDCHSAALVSRSGSIDWCALPRMDGESVFGRLLDWDHGGFCAVAPTGAEWTASRRYLPRTLVLETRFSTPTGEARLTDAFAMRVGGRDAPYRQLLRVVEGVEGEVELAVRVSPRFAYGTVRPWIRTHADGVATAIGGDQGLVVWNELGLAMDGRHDLAASFTLRAGERRRLALRFAEPHRIYPDEPAGEDAEEFDRRFAATLDWWRRWCEQAGLPGADEAVRAAMLRSALVIKGLTNAPTGAVAAAATTSLPEAVGGARNWDYRYCWVRDSSFALESLLALGFEGEARGFRLFIERTTAGNADDLQVVYGVGGEHRLTETVLDHLEGYRGSRPVRVGNGAYRQRQLDLYGELVDVAWRSSRHGHAPDGEYWDLLVRVLEVLSSAWRRPDCGLWEVRCEPRHFVHSKVMCWAGFDQGVRLAEEFELAAPVADWRRARDEIRAAVEARGYDAARGVFVQAFGHRELDAALLLLPRVGFVAYDDPRMQRTVDAVRGELAGDRGLLHRYRADDGLEGSEGAFLACSFWLVECLARQGRRDEAAALFGRLAGFANDLGLFAEEVDPASGELLGNFPQALSHYAHVGAALALAETAG